MKEVDTSSLFKEAYQALNRASVLHHESVLRYRLEISQLKFEFKKQVRKKDIYRALNEKQDGALNDLPILQAELEKDQKEALTVKQEHDNLVEKVKIFEAKNEHLVMVANSTTSQVQQKIELINQLWAEIDEAKATNEVWNGRMNLLASEKEIMKAELASVENKLWIAKDKADKWSRLNDDLREQLNSFVIDRDALGREYAALRSKLDTTSADTKEMMAQHKADMEATETRLKTKTEYIKRLSRRETLEEIHAHSFGLSSKIEEARRLKAEENELYEPQSHEVFESSEGSEGSDISGNESSPGEDQA
ncbi:MAR-binding filament-like protein 1-1 [Nicotiana sylvestris]|uniref:MAR-binding filament-like protein 1-1 n=1 Tax=Nicotiana sylvestris TaxID=4096 RepID=UPI00388C5456